MHRGLNVENTEEFQERGEMLRIIQDQGGLALVHGGLKLETRKTHSKVLS